ncbi:NADPH-dependent oxidoreductase [Ectobacillus polymachus]|uniref:NADPH-dependent oxidoreductase n=1 Tax=Ectobacillus polymachus TaxID=1508806 RepID=UPI003A8C823C
MNEVMKTLTNHRSIRSYTNEPVSEEQLNQIIAAAQAAPSSINGQQITIISIQDPEKKAKATEYVGNQPWVAQAPVFLIFCADFYRAKIAAEKNGQPLGITDGVESLLVGATDVGLAMGNAIAAAESMGLGIVPIGGVRKDPQKLIELLGIPEYVFPVCGLVVGHPADLSAKKPRFMSEAIHHRESYNKEQKPFVDAYDDTISAYMKERTDGKEDRTWSSAIAGFYKGIYAPNVQPTILKQGFKLK